MSLFVFQFVIHQWDKNRNSEIHRTEREAYPDRYLVTAEPSYQIFNKHCILETLGDDIPTNVFENGRIRTAILADGRIRLDRFQVSANGQSLEYCMNGKETKTIGPLNENWIQCRYHWRYSVIEKQQLYWMYEKVTLNAVCLEVLAKDCFLKTPPKIVFVD